jgi:hypothetical protein
MCTLLGPNARTLWISRPTSTTPEKIRPEPVAIPARGSDGTAIHTAPAPMRARPTAAVQAIRRRDATLARAAAVA